MQENLSLESIRELIPKTIATDNPEFVAFLSAYFDFLTSRSDDEVNEMGLLNDIENISDIDETPEQFLTLFQKEFGNAIPRGFAIDPRLFYKLSSKFYLIRGSNQSITSFFRLLFNDTVSLYYPYDDVLIPSSGKWSSDFNVYLDNNGFLSDTKYLQDSYYYQKYSYVVRTGYNITSWRSFYKKLIHPAGFIFFGEVFVYAEAIGQGMPFIQPGFPSGFGGDRPVIIDKIFVGSNLKRPYDGDEPVVFDIDIIPLLVAEHDISDANIKRNLFAYQDMRPFLNYTIEELESGDAGLENVNLDANIEYDLPSVTEYKYTASGGQTTFTGSDDNTNVLSYTVGQVEVYVNGYQYTNFTATDGTSVVLGDPATAGDFVVIMNNPYK